MKNSHRITIVNSSMSALIFRLTGIIFLIDTLYAMAFLFFVLVSPSGNINQYFIWFMWLAHTVKFLVIIYFVLRIVSEHLNKKCIIIDHHLHIHSGLLGTDEEVYELNQLRTIKVHQSWLGRRFNYGNLEMTFGSRGFEKNLYLMAINDPRSLEQKMEKYLTM